MHLRPSRVRSLFCAIGAVAALGTGCGGGSSPASPSSTPSPAPTPSPTPSPNPTPGTMTITITANSVSPRTLAVPVGSRVTFVNNDNRAHDMASDPHPEHAACPAINDVGLMEPGQS